MPFPDSNYETEWHIARRYNGMPGLAPPVRLAMPAVMYDVLQRVVNYATTELDDLAPWEIDDQGEYDDERRRWGDLRRMLSPLPAMEGDA